jgi:uncharacterized membrane protein YjjP (DUF1212 family)
VFRVLFLLAVVAALLLGVSGHPWLAFWLAILAGVLAMLPLVVSLWRAFHDDPGD